MTDPARALAGRHERSLLALPSVARMATVLARRCREPSWVRTLVAGLERFRVLAGHADLEALLAAAQADPAVAERSMAALAQSLDGLPDASVAGAAMGPKVWFRLNGVPVVWRSLPAAVPARRLPRTALTDPAERVLVLAPIGSGLHLAELLRLRVGDIGSLGPDAALLADPEAEPLAVRYQQLRGRPGERVTFLSFAAREAVVEHLQRRRRAGTDTGPGAPLVAAAGGGPVRRAAVVRARRRSNAVIRAGGALNVELCRRTGEFFRVWGLPGSRFAPAEMNSAEGGENP